METSSRALDIGAAVGKDEIVIACAEGAFSRRRVRNRRTELKRVAQEPSPAGRRIGMESTGSYPELLAQTAHKLGFVIFVLNPKEVRHCAKGVGWCGKTERVDAELIARTACSLYTHKTDFDPKRAALGLDMNHRIFAGSYLPAAGKRRESVPARTQPLAEFAALLEEYACP